jgi:hypothetical protein
VAEERVRVKYDLEDNASKGLGGILGSLKNLFSPTALLAAGIAGLGATIGSMISAAEESRQVMAQTEAVIKSTGGVAGISADQVAAYAQALSQVTNFDDEAIQSGENLLLTFKAIGKDVFPQATETMLDLATAMHTDLNSAAIQLGKALDDPVQGVLALKKAGVQLSVSQREQIKIFVESGEIAKAQGLILEEVGNQIGGSAIATASPFTILKNTIGNLSEAIGSKLLPFARAGAIGLNELANSFVKFVDKIDVSNAVLNVGLFFDEFLGQTKKTFTAVGYLIKQPFSWSTYVGVFKVLIDGIGGSWDLVTSIFKNGWAATKALAAKMFTDNVTSAMSLTQRLDQIDAETLAAKSKRIKSFSDESKKIDAQILQNATETDKAVVASKVTTFEQAMAAHEVYVSGLEASNKYTFAAEIERLKKMLVAYDGNSDAKAKITVKINGLITKSNEEQAANYIQTETAAMEQRRALGDLSVANEIAANQAMLENKLLTTKQKEDISTNLFNLETKLIIEKRDNFIKAETEALDRKRALGELSVADEISTNQKILQDRTLSLKQREDIQTKLFNLETQQLVNKKEITRLGFSEEQKWLEQINQNKKKGMTDEMVFTNLLLDSSRKAGDEKLSIEKQVANGALDIIKKRIIAEVDAESSKYITSGIAKLVTLNPFGLLEIAAGAVMSAGIRSALSGIKLAEGGVVMPRAGGTQAIIGEAGQAEAVIPLGDPRAKALMGGGGQDRVIILDSDGMTTLAKGVYRKQQYLQRTGQIGSGLI